MALQVFTKIFPLINSPLWPRQARSVTPGKLQYFGKTFGQKTHGADTGEPLSHTSTAQLINNFYFHLLLKYEYPDTQIFHIEKRNIEVAIKVEIMIIYVNLSLNGPG